MRGKNFTEEQKDRILSLKSENKTWEEIGGRINRDPDSIRRLYYREKVNRSMPPKIKASKSIMAGRLAEIAKDIARENPEIPNRRLPEEIRKRIGQDQKIPSYKTIENFLRKSGVKP